MKYFVPAIAVAILLSTAGVAQAASVEANYTLPYKQGNIDFLLNNSSKTVIAGIFKWTRTESTNDDYNGTDPTILKTFYTFCVEIGSTADQPSKWDDIVSGTVGTENPTYNGTVSVAEAKKLSSLWSSYDPLASISSAEDAAAFQVAVWNIVYSDDWDLDASNTSDNFRRNGILDDDTMDALVRVLYRDKDGPCRHVAAIAIGRIGHTRGESALRHAYLKGDSLLQPFAALGLGLYARHDGKRDAANIVLDSISAKRPRNKNVLVVRVVVILSTPYLLRVDGSLLCTRL